MFDSFFSKVTFFKGNYLLFRLYNHVCHFRTIWFCHKRISLNCYPSSSLINPPPTPEVLLPKYLLNPFTLLRLYHFHHGTSSSGWGVLQVLPAGLPTSTLAPQSTSHSQEVLARLCSFWPYRTMPVFFLHPLSLLSKHGGFRLTQTLPAPSHIGPSPMLFPRPVHSSSPLCLTPPVLQISVQTSLPQGRFPGQRTRSNPCDAWGGPRTSTPEPSLQLYESVPVSTFNKAVSPWDRACICLLSFPQQLAPS